MTVKTIQEGKERFYLVGENKYLSVTTILSILSVPWLKVWEARVGKSAANRIGKRAANYGSVIHGYCDKVVNGKKPKIKKKYKKDMDAFKEWVNENVEEVVSSEEAVWSDVYLVAGRYDFLGRLKDRPGLTIVDWKTGRIKKEHFLQLAAYRFLASECTDVALEDIQGRLVVRIKDGKVSEHQPKMGRSKKKVDDVNIDTDWEVYKSIITAYNWFRK